MREGSLNKTKRLNRLIGLRSDNYVVGEVTAQPSKWFLAGIGVRPATSELKQGSSFHGGQQWGILGNVRKRDLVMVQEREKDSNNTVKLFY